MTCVGLLCQSIELVQGTRYISGALRFDEGQYISSSYRLGFFPLPTAREVGVLGCSFFPLCLEAL